MITAACSRPFRPTTSIPKVKQYLKKDFALRIETAINNTRDFDIGRRVSAENFAARRAIGEQTNQRLLDAQIQACQCSSTPRPSSASCCPPPHEGQRAPRLRFGDPRVMALQAWSLRELVTGLLPGLHRPPDARTTCAA